jgi:type I restriction enzyme R subunit
VRKYRDERGDGGDKEVRAEITRAVDASPSLRNKKDLIEAFVDRVSVAGAVDQEWAAFVTARRNAELTHLIADEGLNPDAARDFIDRAFRDGVIQTTGVAITRVLPPVSRFSPGGGHGEKKQRVLDRFAEFFERYFGLG